MVPKGKEWYRLMRKIASFFLALLIVSSLASPVFAQKTEFVPSITYKGKPSFVPVKVDTDQFENLIADFLCKSGQRLYYFQKDSGLELDFLVRYKGECVVLEVKAKSGKAKSLKTVLKNKDVYHVNNAIKLGGYNVGREEEVLTVPLYMGFLVKDKLADVVVPDIDLNLLN